MSSDTDNRNMKTAVYILTLLAMVILPLSVVTWKLYVLNLTFEDLVPAQTFRVGVNMRVDGHGEDIVIRTYLPRSDDRQEVLEEASNADGFLLGFENDELNRLGVWEAKGVEGHRSIRYEYEIKARHIVYEIPPGLMVPESYPPALAAYLHEEPGVQVEDPQIQARTTQLVPEANTDILTIVTRLHRHLQDEFSNRDFSGFTDALTALRLGEASCNGKGRLFVAMARTLNIPARLVGGIILSQGNKRTSHQWVELYINGYWVPFDTINDHFAQIPENYLTLYYGDKGLFKRTSNVNFQYMFSIEKNLVPKREALARMESSALNIMNLYGTFEKIGISQDLLKIILMIPLGAFVVVVCRNVIGLETFGTFLPALIAAASRQTGLFWGLVGFVLIIVLSSLVRRFLDWMHLLHSPKMAILLTTVVVVMMTVTVLSVEYGFSDLAHVTLFPIAVLAITAERFALIEEEQGLGPVIKITLTSLLVISACFVVMDSVFMQNIILSFPELLLLVVALNLWLGKWIGMRFSEFYRFRRLIFSRA